MSALLNLFILVAIAAFIMIAWRYLQQRADEKLRNNPPPRRIIELSLPVGVADSAVNMARFYRKVSAAALGDKGARKIGARQVDFVYLVDVPAEGALPRMRCRIYADPDKMDAVKKALKSSFQEGLDVIELPDDDLLPVARMLRPEEKTEEEAVEDMEFAPEDFRALLEEGGSDEEELDSDDWQIVEAEEDSETEMISEDSQEAAQEAEAVMDDAQPSKETAFPLDADEKEPASDADESQAVPDESVEIEDQSAPLKPQKSSGVQTLDFIISEDDQEEPPKF